MSKDFLRELQGRLNASAKAYYSKVQGDNKDAMRRADSIDRQISTLRRYKASYSRRTARGGKESDRRALTGYEKEQRKFGEGVRKWNEKNSKAARKTIEENNNFKNSVNDNDFLKRLNPGLFNSNVNARNEARGNLVTNLKTARIFPKTGQVQDIGKFKKTAAYALQKIEQMLEQQRSDNPQRNEVIDGHIQFFKDEYQKVFNEEVVGSFTDLVNEKFITDVAKIPELLAGADSQQGLETLRMYSSDAEIKPAGEDLSEEIDHYRVKVGLRPKYGTVKARPTQPPAVSATDQEKTAYIRSQFPGLVVQGGQVTVNPKLPESLQQAVTNQLTSRQVRLPQSYQALASSPQFVAESFSSSTTFGDIDAEIERLTKRRDAILTEASRRGPVTTGQLQLLSHPFLPAPGFREALPISSLAFSGDFQAKTQAVTPLSVDPVAASGTGLTDEQIMASDPEGPDDFEPDLTIREPDSMSEYSPVGLPGVRVVPAIVRRLKSSLDETSAETPKELAADFNQLPDSVKSRFPIAFVNAIDELATMDTKGGDQIEVERQKLRRIMDDFEDLILDDEARVADFVLELRDETFPSEKSNQATSLMQFLNHESALGVAEDQMPAPTGSGPQALTRSILGGAGTSLLNLSKEVTDLMMQDEDAFFDPGASPDLEGAFAQVIQEADESISQIQEGDRLAGVRMASMEDVMEASEGLRVRPQARPTGLAARGSVDRSGGKIGTIDVPTLTGDDEELARSLADLGTKPTGRLPGEQKPAPAPAAPATPPSAIVTAPKPAKTKRPAPAPVKTPTAEDIQFAPADGQIAMESATIEDQVGVDKKSQDAYLGLYVDVLDRIRAFRTTAGREPGQEFLQNATDRLNSMAEGLGMSPDQQAQLEDLYNRNSADFDIPRGTMNQAGL